MVLIPYLPRPLRGELLENGRHLMLLADFEFHEGDLHVIVPEDFVTDFHSIPRALWSVFSPWEYPEAAVIHDFLYRYNGVSRAVADATHDRILELLGCPAWKRHGAYVALRAFGWVTWGRYRATRQNDITSA